MKIFLIILSMLVSFTVLADEYLGRLSANPYGTDSTSNPYGQGLSIYSDDDG